MWQKRYEQYSKDYAFTVVGLALDVEGIDAAKRYYQKHKVTFPALVDPNYATGFAAVPKTFFVDEHGVVQPLRGWQHRLKRPAEIRPVTPEIRAQWSKPGQRLSPQALARLLERHRKDPKDLTCAVELASRYLDVGLSAEARQLLLETVAAYDARRVARSSDQRTARLLAQAYLELSRACVDDRDARVRYATLAFFLRPTVGFGKQIARLIDPARFDNWSGGSLDNAFREGTLRRLQRERAQWLQAP